MTDVDLSRVGELLRSVFELLWKKPDGLPSMDIFTLIPKVTELTEYELGYPLSHRNTPRYERIIRLASVPLFRVGWLAKNNKGRWYVTESGRQACKRIQNGQELYREAYRLFDDRRQSTLEIIIAAEIAEEITWEKIQNYLLDANLTEFQKLVMDLLMAMGYYVMWAAPPEKRLGHWDVIAQADPVGVTGRRILVQVKHIGQPITLEGLRAVLTLLGSNDIGLVVSSGGFTHDAKNELQKEEFNRITALDLEAFFDLWILYYDKLSQEAKQRFPLRPIYALWHLG